MIYTLYGKVFEVDVITSSVVIECGGVGYKLTVSANTISKIPSPEFDAGGNSVSDVKFRMYSHMAVRDDGIELYGFYSKEELDAFKLLISVSGVGPKAAMAILSLFTPNKLFAAILAEDTKAISRAPGVGGKTAARIALDLKDKVAKLFPSYSADDGAGELANMGPAAGGSSKLSDARDALAVLGYSRSEIAAAMKNVDLNGSVEEIIKASLAALMKSQ